MLSLLVFQSVLIFEKIMNQQDALIVFHKSRFSVIGIKNNTFLTVAHNLDSTAIADDYSIINYKIGNAITQIKEDSLENIYLFQNKTLLVIDSLGFYQIPEFNPDYILLRNSPQINLMRLLEYTKPQLIIADGSNYKSYLQRWETTCLEQKIPFHLTSRAGAFVLKEE